SASGATLQATINPNGLSTSARFQYSTDPSFTPTVVTTIYPGFSAAGVAVDAVGDLFLTTAGALKEVLPNGTIKTSASGFNGPGGVAVDADGDVFVTESGTGAVKEVLPDGTIKTIASGFSGPRGVAVDTAGDVFVTESGTGAVKEVLP